MMNSALLRVRNYWKKLYSKFKKLSFKKKLIVIALFLVLGIVIFQIISNLTKKPGYILAKAEISDVTETVTETGKISSGGAINIYSPTNGIVENVFVSNGDYVSEGEELFTVKSSATEQEKQAAYANYMAAVSNLGNAKANLHALQSAMFSAWDIYKNLAEGDKYENEDKTPKTDQRTLPEFQIAEKNWLASEAQYKNQESVVTQAQAQVASAWLLFQATQNATVKAPTNGAVSNLSVTNGSSVSVNIPTLPSVPVLTLSNPSTTEVVISLSETDIAKVKEGQSAMINISSVSDKNYTGVVRRVDLIGTEELGVVRYNTYIELLKPDSSLRPGMTADASIITNQVKNVIAVPNSAVKPYRGGRAVRVIGEKGEIKFVPVKTGIRGKDKTQILSGINEGQEVITALSNEQIKRSGIFGN